MLPAAGMRWTCSQAALVADDWNAADVVAAAAAALVLDDGNAAGVLPALIWRGGSSNIMGVWRACCHPPAPDPRAASRPRPKRPKVARILGARNHESVQKFKLTSMQFSGAVPSITCPRRSPFACRIASSQRGGIHIRLQFRCSDLLRSPTPGHARG